MDVCALSQNYKDYNIINNINENTSCINHFDSSKYLVVDGYNGDGYSILYNNTTKLKEVFQGVRNGYYPICGSTSHRFSYNRSVQHL